MYYVFHQNNNYGKYLSPAREVAIEAETHDEALEKFSLIPGVYFSDKSDKECDCCRPRWQKSGYDYTPEEFLEYFEESKRLYKEWQSPKIPHLMVVKADGSEDYIRVGDSKPVDSAPMDAPVPVAEEAMAQECPSPVEGEKSSVSVECT